jgi:amidophosphoribosyltransferase
MCGFVGIIGLDPVAPGLTLGLQAIQHRGQDAAGVGTSHAGRFHVVKACGLVTTAVQASDMSRLPGQAGISHVRYPTAGGESTAEDAQPFVTRSPGIVMAHNGNLTNVDELTTFLRDEGVHVLSQCDAEPLLLTLAVALNRIRTKGHTAADIGAAVKEVYGRVRGGYTVVAVMEVDGRETLVAFRDPHGIRPGVYAQRTDGSWVVASESVTLDVLDARPVAQLPAGEVMLFRANEAPVRVPVQTSQPTPCVFERIYFARPDSVMEDGRVNRARWRMGRVLAEEWTARGLKADLVVAVPDTSRPAAMAMAEALELPNREGFIKNRYSGRTFIMPNQSTRDAALRLKLNPIREMFEGNRVLLVDDSIVRGSTMKRIVRLLRTLNPVEIHLAIFSPPVKHPCFYGIDMPSADELIASRMDQDQLAAHLGADSVTYLSIDGLRAVNGQNICDACFTGSYVVPVSQTERDSINSARRP